MTPFSLPGLSRFRRKVSTQEPRTPHDTPGHPAPRPGLRPLVAAGIDLGILGLMKKTRRFPNRDDLVRVRKEISATHELYEKHGFLDCPAAFHGDPPIASLLKTSRGWCPAGRYTHIQFPSGYRPPSGDQIGERWLRHRENQTAHAWVLEGDPTAPWLVCLHGLGTGSPWLDLPAFEAEMLHRTMGLNLIFPVLPLHGPRRGPNVERGGLLSFELIESLHGVAQGVWDTRRLLGWIRSRGATTIGLYGQSMGSYVAALVAGLEDIELVLSAIPLCDIPTLFDTHSPARLRAQTEDLDILGPELDRVFEVISPAKLCPTPPRHRRFIVAGRSDQITHSSQALALWQAWRGPNITWFNGGHLSYFWSSDARTARHQAIDLLTTPSQGD